MAIYDNLPYTNFHELNATWLLQQMAEAKAKVDEIQDDIDRFNATYAALAAVLTVSGNNVSIPGTMTANGFIGNLTGNVTGNASTATHATTADSATSAASATNADHATTADSATTAGSATTATNATNASSASTATYAVDSSFATEAESLTWHDDITSSDMNDYIDLTLAMALYKATNLTTNIPNAITSGASAVILSLLAPSNAIMQCAWFYAESLEIYVRFKFGGTWQAWRKITLA